MAFIDWKCPKCGKEIRVDNMRKSCYCNVCGSKIEVAPSVIQSVHQSVETLVDWTCPKCGREIRVYADRATCYCNACGKKIELSANKARFAPATGSKEGAAAIGERQPATQPAAGQTVREPTKAGVGTVIAMALFCDFVMSVFMGIISMGVFRRMGFTAYLGPSLLSLALSIALGMHYRKTGKNDASDCFVYCHRARDGAGSTLRRCSSNAVAIQHVEFACTIGN